jgi:hypothetical protein
VNGQRPPLDKPPKLTASSVQRAAFVQAKRLAREFMNRRGKAAVAMLVLACGLSEPVSAGLFEDGSTAWNRGDHTIAIRIFRQLADQGDPKAQNKLGTMYQHGWGVPQNYSDAGSGRRQTAETPTLRTTWPSCFFTVGALHRITSAHICGSTWRLRQGKRRLCLRATWSPPK